MERVSLIPATGGRERGSTGPAATFGKWLPSMDDAPMPGHDAPTGYDLLRNARLNKGTAFNEAERRARGLEGLLPPATTTIELQIARLHAELARLDNDLQKYLLLSDLQARNE